MVTRLRHSTEISGPSATIYLGGIFRDGDSFVLNRICLELPSQVTSIRLDLHGLEDVGAPTIAAVRGVLRYWRESRGGSFRLSLSSKYIVATYAEGVFVGTSGRSRSRAMTR